MATTESDLGGPADLSEDEQRAVEAQLLRLADDELVQAERYTFWQVRAPTLESDLSISNNAQDELGHARLWYDAVQQLGYSEESLIYESDPSDFQHSTLVELPFAEGDWADAIVRAYLYDVAEDIRLSALEDSSYEIIRNRTSRIQGEEGYHLEHAESWLDRMALDEEASERVQAAIDELYPYALTLFEPVGDVEADIDRLGIRTMTLDEMRTEWETRVESFLTELGFDVPTDAAPATPAGRDNEHTDHWHDLHDEMTASYRNLGRDEATLIMAADDE
ncbi:1,2-phenylacetyl-CoA epoxidase subunit PaaC (plasmid) [Haloarcula sp. KBTZ06]|uniref:Phenylacetate-CoA oxygenase subunit PaaI n=1 Tax=Haloarcula hispanica TaxID=51589 RepID=A0A482TF94_HALHI|nr:MULTISPECIES: 1,2-phenylacetyl-CoA epoxidase subunit PaaC [Haloarcula]AJF24318.1 phenylacetic acid degradation protein PaaC [Haloarcula sp. CBA1115]KAA9400901.1 phenylacetate-CoA oxygenase subunit PaaI [Haloarcula sp. CBA1131]KZX50018.1 phenylacetic acid degradation protein PaaC [Haloarcula sp. K1]MCJ0618048.1 phenylacetate-CoA oxygenase subunit PaaC [Haloarcula hispanica]RYJ15567.1 phenylacetate-CoA oxygenase subunit PaaI [Haloarcula hispanica]